MMPAFFEYLRNISYYLVFMALVGVIAPSGNYKKYIALVMGIMLVGIVINPVTNMLGRESLPVTQIFGNIMPAMPYLAQDGSFDWQHEHLREAFHAQLSAQTASLLARNNFHLVSAYWSCADDFSYIRSVILRLRLIETTPTPRPFIRIEPVRIGPYQPADTDEADEKVQKVKKLISDFYDMRKDNIHVEILER